jgi:hypothetical protein
VRPLFEQLSSAAEPRALETPLISGKHRALVEHALRPLASLDVATFGGQQVGIVQVGLR